VIRFRISSSFRASATTPIFPPAAGDMTVSNRRFFLSRARGFDHMVRSRPDDHVAGERQECESDGVRHVRIAYDGEVQEYVR